MKKIALISDGWRRMITYAWVDGIIRRIRELDEDIALYQYNCYGNWSKDALHNTGEYNIYNLPDLSAFDGIILDGSNIVDVRQKEKIVERLQNCGVPVLSLDWYISGFYYVGADNRRPIRELMTHLYEVHGCRRFVFAGGPEDAFGNFERVAAYCECLKKYGMTLDDNPILCGDYDYETGVNYMREYVHSGSKLPDVFVCANDNIAAGICAEAEQWGYRVPDDFLVTGFDNLDKAAYFRPQITTVFQDREEIGKLCVDVLLRIWEGKPVEERNYIPVTCIYGESCGCPNNGMVNYREYIKEKIVATVNDTEKGMGSYHAQMDDDALEFLADMANGDARAALTAIELGILTTDRSEDGIIHITLDVASECIQKRVINYDKTGDNHYDTISAFIKSMRGSDPDAAVYYLARMLYAGEDVKFIARRIMILASEDIGNADPQALQVAVAAAQAVERLGMPEARIVLAQAVTYMASAPKSNSAINAIDKAMRVVQETKTPPVPVHLQDAHYKSAGKLGHGKGYKYAHDYKNHYVKQQYLPDGLTGEVFYEPSENGYEQQIRAYYKKIKENPEE